ncbi:MAG: alkaline phosphatase family protein [bacterium]|nr:alkaline phosphatase family protein [bacterium]
MVKPLQRFILLSGIISLLSIIPITTAVAQEEPRSFDQRTYGQRTADQRPRFSPEERFKQMDRNGDGKLTESEFPRPEFFQQIDKNNDGSVTLAEFMEAMAQFRGRRQRESTDTTAQDTTPTPIITPIIREPRVFPKNVILISWDGLDRSVVNELLEKRELINLARLIREGSIQEIEVVGHLTCTKPSHAEMLTGLSADQTGVYSNTKFQPIPEGYTIFERLQNHFGGKDKIRTIMVTGKLAHVGARGPEEVQKSLNQKKKKAKQQADSQVPTGVDATIVSVKGEPFYLTKNHLDICDIAQRNADEVGTLSLKYLAQDTQTRFFAFLHFSDPDHAGHRFGIDSKEYRDAAIACDEQLGKILTYLKEQRIYNQTLMYVMTDHGFDEHSKSHRFAPHSWLVTNDKKVTRGGIIADVPATIMVRFGIDISKLEPKLIGTELTGAPREIKPSDYVQPAKKQTEPQPQNQQKQLTVEERFKKFDTNADGKLTAAEFPRPKVFKQMDADNDGSITFNEMKVYQLNKQAAKSTTTYSTTTTVP